MTLWEQIEPFLERALATRGVQLLAVDGDEELWVAGVAAVDGSLELRTGTSGAKRGMLRRHEIDRAAMAALGFSEAFGDAWALGLEPVPLLAPRGAAVLEQALTGPMSAHPDARVTLVLEETGPMDAAPGAPHLEHLQAAVRVWEQDREARISVGAGRPSRNCLDLVLRDGTARLGVIPPEGADLAIAGFDADELGWPFAELGPGEVARAADTVLHQELGVREDDPLFVHLLPRE
jgi:hypothetical protein